MRGRPEKYTLKFCLNEIKNIEAVLFSDTKWDYITWHDLVKNKTYPRQVISEWRKKFEEDKDFSDTIKRIDSELENRLYKLGLKGKANSTLVIFGLKNNYGWKDRQEHEHTGKDGERLLPQIVVVDNKTATEVDKLINGNDDGIQQKH